MRNIRGFTLIELITVMVVLAIVAAIGSGFVVTAVESYRDTQERAKLVQKGRLAIEQMTRQLRMALPHSLRVSDPGNCIEFLPIVGGAAYLEPVPDVANDIDPAKGSPISTSPLVLDIGEPQYVAIGGLCPREIYGSLTCSGDITSASPLAPLTVTPVDGDTSISFNEQTFIRNSVNRRLFVTGSPRRFCVAADNNLRGYSDYPMGSSLSSNTSPGGLNILIVSDVEAAGDAFVLSDGSQDRNTAVHINLRFLQGNTAVELNHQVLVRNVP